MDENGRGVNGMFFKVNMSVYDHCQKWNPLTKLWTDGYGLLLTTESNGTR